MREECCWSYCKNTVSQVASCLHLSSDQILVVQQWVFIQYLGFGLEPYIWFLRLQTLPNMLQRNITDFKVRRVQRVYVDLCIVVYALFWSVGMCCSLKFDLTYSQHCFSFYPNFFLSVFWFYVAFEIAPPELSLGTAFQISPRHTASRISMCFGTNTLLQNYAKVVQNYSLK